MLESKETDKGRGKTRRGLLQGRRGRQRGQRGTHAGSSEFQRQGKLARTPGLGNREKREKEKETAAGPEDLNWARAELNAKATALARTKLQTTNKTPNATTTCSAQNIIGLYFQFLLTILDNTILTTTRDETSQ